MPQTELFSLPWKLCGSLHPSKLHCPDILYFPTKYTEWRYYLIMVTLASFMFFSNNRTRFWMMGPLESAASVALSCVKSMLPASCTSYQRWAPGAVAIAWMEFYTNHSQKGADTCIAFEFCPTCVSLCLCAFINNPEPATEEKGDGEISSQA